MVEIQRRVAFYCRLSKEESELEREKEQKRLLDNQFREFMTKVNSMINKGKIKNLIPQETSKAIQKYIVQQKERTTY